MERQRRTDLRRLTDIRSKKTADEYTNGERAWPMFNSSLSDLEGIFGELFPNDEAPLEHFVEGRRAAGKPTIALDLMGDGHGLHGLFPDHALAVCLTDQRSRSDRAFDDATGLEVMGANLLKRQTWQRIQDWLKRYQPEDPHFHLIIENGGGALNFYPTEPDFYNKLLSNIWRLMSTDNSLAVLNAPPEITKLIPAWAKQLQDSGVSITYALEQEIVGYKIPYIFPIIRLEKFPDSPEQLPSLK